jgi:hypothetical protein
MRNPDVVALVFGLLLSAVAVAALWQSFVGALDWELLKIAAPLALVMIGVLGLALSRNRS